MTQHPIIDDFLRYQKAADKSGLTIKTYRSDLYIFAHWFEQANDEDLKMHKITPTDLRQYKQHMERYAKPRDTAVIKIFLNTGLRVQELCDLMWQDIVIASRSGRLTRQTP